MNIFTEYPKAIVTILMGVIVQVLVRANVADILTPEVQAALETVLLAGTTFIVGRFTRMSKSEARNLE